MSGYAYPAMPAQQPRPLNQNPIRNSTDKRNHSRANSTASDRDLQQNTTAAGGGGGSSVPASASASKAPPAANGTYYSG